MSLRDKIIQMLKVSHRLLLIHECELNILRHKTHIREYEQRLINFCYNHYIINNLSKKDLC